MMMIPTKLLREAFSKCVLYYNYFESTKFPSDRLSILLTFRSYRRVLSLISMATIIMCLSLENLSGHASIATRGVARGGDMGECPPVMDWKKNLAPELQTDGCFATGVTR